MNERSAGVFQLTKKNLVVVSGILIATSFIFHRIMGYTLFTVIIMLASTVIAGTPIFKKAFGALRYRIVGIDALVTIAVIGAIIIGEYWEAAAVTFLFMVGDYLEGRTIEKTRSSIKALLSLAPHTARVRRGEEDFEIPVEQVELGDIVVIKPGERIAVDGFVIEGSAYVNQSTITGESTPVGKGKEDQVFSGTVVDSGYVIVRAERVGSDTMFARILEMVEEAQDKKAVTQKFLEKFSRYYTPAIILLSTILYISTGDIRLALTLLVIACPGALVISAPVSIVAGIGNGAKNGVLVKGGDIMEKLGTVKVVAFDKTGTLTVGRPVVVALKTYNGETDDMLRIATVGEAYSEHPLAKAIVHEATLRFGSFQEKPQDSQLIQGQGLRFVYRDTDYLVGNRTLLVSHGLDISPYEVYLEQEERLARTTVLVSDREKILGIISIADTVRPGAKDLVLELKRIGIKKVIMLTGDNEWTAQAIAGELGLDGFKAGLLPQDKVAVLQDLQTMYGRVAMVGDGVNDAPALASADLGVAIGGVGSDIAMETADVVLMSSDIGRLPYAMALSRATVHNMKQNIMFALAVAAFLLAGVLIKTVNLSMGMLVHEISVLLVIVNAVRLLGFKRSLSKKS
jgi:Zn2+/Cd2+-exporting ATPase